jgi:hypothetical protein
MKSTVFTAIALLVAATAPAVAQDAAPPPPAIPAHVGPPPPPPTLIFEREVFEYPASGRRDPFRPLNTEETGPQFTTLILTGIIYYPGEPDKSLAAFKDGQGKPYRMHRGDRVGNATIQFIDKTQVVFSVEEFGMKRQEVLQLSSQRAGA